MTATQEATTTHDAHGDHHDPNLAHHFDTPSQQFDSGKYGIWLFLLTEILFFSGLFCAYVVYRALHPEIFIFGAQFLDTTLGAVNTIVLICSSLTAAWAVRNAQLNQQGWLKINLAITLLCAFGFLGIKAVEYNHKIHHGHLPGNLYAHHEPEVLGVPDEEGFVQTIAEPEDAHLFFSIYFCMTGLHAFHVLIGIILFFWILWRAMKGHFGPTNFAAVDYSALYWHLVDLIWIYLFPLLYLIH